MEIEVFSALFRRVARLTPAELAAAAVKEVFSLSHGVRCGAEATAVDLGITTQHSGAFESARKLWLSGGLRRLFWGGSAELGIVAHLWLSMLVPKITEAVSTAVQALAKRTRPDLPEILQVLLHGAVSKAVCILLAEPLATLNTFLNVQGVKHLHLLRSKIRTGGLRILWDGAGLLTIGGALGHYLYSPLFSGINSRLPRVDQASHPLRCIARDFLVHFLASVVSDAASHPAKVVATMKRASLVPIGTMGAIRGTTADGGFRALLLSGFSTVVALKLADGAMSFGLYAIHHRLSSPNAATTTSQNPPDTDTSAETDMSLLAAAFNGVEDEVQRLLTMGAQVDVVDDDGDTPLILAATKGHEGVVAALLADGAQVGLANNSGKTALIWAAFNGQHDVVAALLDHGAQIDQADKSGACPLFYSAHEGHRASVAVLLAEGAQVDLAMHDGCTPLLIAAQNGHESVVAALLAKGAQSNLATNDGATSLFAAAEGGHDAIVAALLAGGAQVDLARASYGDAPLCMAAQNGHEAVVKLLLANAAQIDLADKNGATPIFHAAMQGHGSVVAALLAKGAKVGLATNDGDTPLSMAQDQGHDSVVSLLTTRPNM